MSGRDVIKMATISEAAMFRLAAEKPGEKLDLGQHRPDTS